MLTAGKPTAAGGLMGDDPYSQHDHQGANLRVRLIFESLGYALLIKIPSHGISHPPPGKYLACISVSIRNDRFITK